MRISVIIPTFNRAAMLGQLLDSIHGQSHRPIEVVIIDDGSSDNTWEVFDRFSRRSGKSDYLECVYRLLPRGGAQVARNCGIAVSTGDAIMFVDSDDTLHPEGLEQLVRPLEADPSCGFTYGQVQTVDANLELMPSSCLVGSKFDDSAKGLFDYHWHTMGALYTRECINKVGEWNTSLKCSQDWEYQVRVKLFGGRGVFVNALVGYWRQHKGERIGVNTFREDYTESTATLFRSIHGNVELAHRRSRQFDRLLVKRLLRHAVYAGAHGRRQAKRDIVDLAASVGSEHLLIVATGMLRASPSLFDKALLYCVNKLKPAGLKDA